MAGDLNRIDAALKYILHSDDPESFPFFSVDEVLHHLASDAPDNAARRQSVRFNK